MCPKCGGLIELMYIQPWYDTGDTEAWEEERLYYCPTCLSSWTDRSYKNGEISDLKRYFFG